MGASYQCLLLSKSRGVDEQVALLRYRISFSIPTSDPHSSRVPSLWDGFIQGFALQLRGEMLEKGTLEVISDQTPGVYSHFFLMEKATVGW